MAKLKKIVIDVSVGLKPASLGSVEGLKSMMLINRHGHFGESHAGEIGMPSTALLGGSPEEYILEFFTRLVIMNK